jgi:Flp pilus assembly pilin Flp
LLHRVPPLPACLKDEDGQTIIEYAFVLGLVSVVFLAVFVGSGLFEQFEGLVDNLFPD